MGKKIFGVALDPSDDPRSLELKKGWMGADIDRLDPISTYLDPYDAVTKLMGDWLSMRGITKAGKFPVPRWLWPKPPRVEMSRITSRNMEIFFESGGLAEISQEIKSFVKDHIFPDDPIMLGVDHSATAGVISALAEKYSPETISVVVLDQHFDAIPLSQRLEGAVQTGSAFSTVPNPVGFSDHFCCGNFWAYLLDEGIMLPQNLLLIGVADYPSKEDRSRKNSYRDAYLAYEARGCKFFSRNKFVGEYGNNLSSFLRDNIHTPNVYLSFDIDIGSFTSTYAARYMEKPGIGKKEILDIAQYLVEGNRSGRFKLIGMDVMEFNMHFLGIEMPDGKKDTTLDLVMEFMTIMAAYLS